jgi:hypothetical protein
MKKTLPKTASTEASIPPDAKHSYVYLADGRVARIVKPIQLGNQKYYALMIAGKQIKYRSDKVSNYLPNV